MYTRIICNLLSSRFDSTRMSRTRSSVDCPPVASSTLLANKASVVVGHCWHSPISPARCRTRCPRQAASAHDRFVRLDVDSGCRERVLHVGR